MSPRRSKRNKDDTVDTAALRQMIRRKLEEKQRASPGLVSRNKGHVPSAAMQQPVIVNTEATPHSQGSASERDGVKIDRSEACADKTPTHVDARQQRIQVAHAKKLLKSASQPKARTNENERRRKESKEKVVRKGFG